MFMMRNLFKILTVKSVLLLSGCMNNITDDSISYIKIEISLNLNTIEKRAEFLTQLENWENSIECNQLLSPIYANNHILLAVDCDDLNVELLYDYDPILREVSKVDFCAEVLSYNDIDYLSVQVSNLCREYI